MANVYPGVAVRFLREDERLIPSLEKELPLVIEATEQSDNEFLQRLLAENATQIMEDIGRYGALLLRGFDISSEREFENTVMSIPEMKGITDTFMSEEGRVHVGDLKYVLHTNAVYKTGGTLYLGGFHSENYYSTDVPSYICFCCFQPSEVGGETGLINGEKIYESLDENLKKKLEKNTFLAKKWLVTEVAKRYRIAPETVEKISEHFDLPIVGKGADKFVLMYKPSVFKHPLTQKKSLQINLFTLPKLNQEMRKHFIKDYQGKTWFWHRFVWRLPYAVFRSLEFLFVMFISFFHSPKDSLEILRWKIASFLAAKKINKLPQFHQSTVSDCFTGNDIKNLAQLIRKHYSSFLWKKGDILLVDNRKVMHAGMPGAGSRKIRAMICNPIAMNYSFLSQGCIDCQDSSLETVGFYMEKGGLTFHIDETDVVGSL
jgi:alpha-ketoglutarate-dependent taurine dioxygenase